MASALADYFFIAGLEGNEPDILSASLNTLKTTDLTTQEETIKEEIDTPSTPKQVVIPQEITISDVPPSPQESKVPPSSPTPALPPQLNLDRPPLTPDSDTHSNHQRNSTTFEDVITKFASERDEFLLTLGGPTIPLTPRSTTPVRELRISNEEEKDKVPELHQPMIEGSPTSPLHPRASIRNRLVDISRRASSRVSRSSTLRRGNTQCKHPPEVTDE